MDDDTSRDEPALRSHVVVVLPVYNEADSIEAVLGEVREAAERLDLVGVRTSVVLVDDESPDGTGEVAEAFARRVGLPLTLLRGQRDGLGSAMLRGLAEALNHDPDAIVTLDGDGQHNPTSIPTLHRAFTARHADIVIGSRWTRGGRAPGTSPFRSVGSRVGNTVFRLVSGTRGVKDATTSFRVYSPRVVRFLLSTRSNRYRGFAFFSTTIGLAEAAGFTITEVPIEFRPRYGGQSKLNSREVWRYFASLPRIRAERRQLEVSATGGGAAEAEARRHAARWGRPLVDASLRHVRLGGVERIVLVGAGAEGLVPSLRSRFPVATVTRLTDHEQAADASDERVRVVRGALGDRPGHVEDGKVDLVVYVNLLDQLGAGDGELAAAAGALRPGGVLAVLAPAMPSLYSPHDARSGRAHRYTPAALRELVAADGLDVVHVGYVDRVGLAPHWLNFRLLNKSDRRASGGAATDRLLAPASRLAERGLRWMPAGRSVVCIARRR